MDALIYDRSYCVTALARHGRRRLVFLGQPFTPDAFGIAIRKGDPDFMNYNIFRESHDVIELLDHLGLERVVVLGTSRGGLIAMLMAAFSPTVLHGIILNDVGPEIEPRGLLRLKGYIGQIPEPKSWGDAAHMLHQTNKGFENLSDAQWAAWANAVAVRELDFHDTFLAAEYGRAAGRRVTLAWVLLADRTDDLDDLARAHVVVLCLSVPLFDQTAAAPPTISEISWVMAAWRALL